MREKKNQINQQYTKEEFLELWEQYGKSTVGGFAEKLGVSSGIVKKKLIEWGAIQFQLNKKQIEITREDLIKDKEAGLSLSALGKKYKIHRSDIALLLDYHQIPRKKLRQFNERFFIQDSPEVFYLAGLLAADGCVFTMHQRKVPGGVSLALKESDLPHIEKVKKLLQFDGHILKGICDWNHKQNPKHNITIMYGIRFHSEQMCQDLVRFGIGERKSLTYKMPEWLVEHPLVNFFLLGYFDGDGSLFVNKKKKWGMNFRGTLEFCQQIHQILIKHQIVEDKPKRSTMQGGQGRIGYSGARNCARIYEFFWQKGKSEIYLERKYLKYLEVLKKIEKMDQQIKLRKLIYLDYQRGLTNTDLSKKYQLAPSTISGIVQRFLSQSLP